jgi:DNA-directed RNA polymerase specialized sigma24 family protein
MEHPVMQHIQPSALKADEPIRPGPSRVARFERLFAPMVESAYRTARCLVRSPQDAEELVARTAVLALDRLGRQATATEFRLQFLGMLVQTFQAQYQALEAARSTGVAASEGPTRAADDAVLQTLLNLSPPDRVVAALYFSERLSRSEIATVLACPAETVGPRLRAGRDALRSA